jgi:hypothetical protein
MLVDYVRVYKLNQKPASSDARKIGHNGQSGKEAHDYPSELDR